MMDKKRKQEITDSKVHGANMGANMGPIWGRQDLDKYIYTGRIIH